MAERTGRRRYGEACPVAHALDAIGERWALLVVRELRLGPKRFSDLQASLPKAGPSVLSERLRDLERSGVLHRRTLPPPAGSRVYELTPWGRELEPVFRALARWGMHSPVAREGELSADSVMLAVRTFFRSGTSWTATYRVELERDSYLVRVVDGELAELSRGVGDAADPDAVIAGDKAAVHAVLTGEQSLDAALTGDRLTVTGDQAAVRDLVSAVQHRG